MMDMHLYKTPVSMLHEDAAKKGLQPPEYTLERLNTCTPLNSFEYVVTYNGLIAHGCAYSKKDAKHDAAKKMLAKLQPYQKYDLSPVKTMQLLTKQLPNHMSILKSFCSLHNLPEPKYDLISSDGPPHNLNFTISCQVQEWKAEGRGKTKKEASQKAAADIVENLTVMLQSEPIKTVQQFQNNNADTQSNVMTLIQKVEDEAKSEISGMKTPADTEAASSEKIVCSIEFSSKTNFYKKLADIMNSNVNRLPMATEIPVNSSCLEPAIPSCTAVSVSSVIPPVKKSTTTKETVAGKIANTSERLANLNIQRRTEHEDTVLKLTTIMEMVKKNLKGELQDILDKWNLQMDEVQVESRDQQIEATIILNTTPEIIAVGCGSSNDSAEINAIVEAMTKLKIKFQNSANFNF